MAAQCDETAHLAARGAEGKSIVEAGRILIAWRGCCSIYRLGGLCVLGSAGTGAQIRASRGGCE